MPARERLKANRIRSEAQCSTIGREVVVLDETGSTNDVVLEMAGGDWPEGLVVFAEHQTAGRGQRGNRWESAPYQGLWFSVLLRPEIALKDSGQLSAWAARAVAEAIGGAMVKLPNDVYIGGHKVAGVLVEMRAQPDAAHVAILGVGVNVNQMADDFPEELRERATSLAIVHRSRQDRHALAVRLLRNLDRTYRELFARPL